MAVHSPTRLVELAKHGSTDSVRRASDAGLTAAQVNEIDEATGTTALIKASMKGPNSGGNQQLNGLFYGLYVQQIVDLMSKGISNGMMKFCVKPLAVRRAIRAHFCAILRANRRNSLTARLALDRC